MVAVELLLEITMQVVVAVQRLVVHTEQPRVVEEMVEQEQLQILMVLQNLFLVVEAVVLE
jgi:hypothetical protein